jgi:para-aminobenzoate synthetase
MSRYRILFIDAYDSFTNNIISLLETELPVDVTKIHIDADIGDLSTFLKPFAAVVAGPGPGNPEDDRDVGLISELWKLKNEDLLPVLGVCLGFQSLAYALGARIERLSGPRHGVSTQVTTSGRSLFEGLPQFFSVQYHSLHAVLEDTEVTSNTSATNTWGMSKRCPELVPLAWDFGTEQETSRQGVLMAIQHSKKPFYGIQFHPESVYSSIEAKSVIKNWWSICTNWHGLQTHSMAQYTVSTSKTEGLFFSRTFNSSEVTTPYSSPALSASSTSLSSMSSYSDSQSEDSTKSYQRVCISLKKLDIPTIVGLMGLAGGETVILDSERRQMPKLGTCSIIGVIEQETIKLSYSVGSRSVQIRKGNSTTTEDIRQDESIFNYLKTYLEDRKVWDGETEIPFWGGFLGYITYEACLETISIPTKLSGRPDVCFAFVERSIVLDHKNKKVYIQSIKANDQEWINKTQDILRNATTSNPSQYSMTFEPSAKRLPNEKSYRSKITACQDQIRAGNSYELCLTNQASFSVPKNSKPSSSWEQYQNLRKLNPAPFASYIQLGSATILSTSPERFMRWTRPSTTASDQKYISTCQFRPIKGTVQKEQRMPDGNVRKVGLQEATGILSTPKEQAENLMIVDLIRHDLYGVVGSGNVRIESLMNVEEYESVFQLVSVIEGDISILDKTNPAVSGIDVLAASLPPGSMTGAPKKRSCELLQEIEDEPRSIYSGVIGYMCVGGGGDFSVVIRTIFKWNDEEEDNHENWRIGAGGAITILSTEEDEWEEMLGKLRSTRRLFEN